MLILNRMRSFKVEEPNLIGNIGEVIAKNILERIYPRFYYNIYWTREDLNLFGKLRRHLINLLYGEQEVHARVWAKMSWRRDCMDPKTNLARCNDGTIFAYELKRRYYKTMRECTCAPVPDFIIESKSKNELIAVEVKTTLHKHIKIRGGAKKELKDQIEKYSACKGITKLILLEISLANFPEIKYRIQEINVLNSK